MQCPNYATLGSDLLVHILRFVDMTDVLTYANAVPQVWCNSSIIQVLLAKLPAECRTWFYIEGVEETGGEETKWNVGDIHDAVVDKRMMRWRRSIRLFFSAMMGKPIIPRQVINEAPVNTRNLSNDVHVVFEFHCKCPGEEEDMTLRVGPCTLESIALYESNVMHELNYGGNDDEDDKGSDETEATREQEKNPILDQLRTFAIGTYNGSLNGIGIPAMATLKMYLLCPNHGLITGSEWNMQPVNKNSVSELLLNPDARSVVLQFQQEYHLSPLYNDDMWTPAEFRRIIKSARLELGIQFGYEWDGDEGAAYDMDRVKNTNEDDGPPITFFFNDGPEKNLDINVDDILMQEVLFGLRARSNNVERMSLGVPISH